MDERLFSELELKTAAVFEKCNADGLRIIGLLVKGRMLAEAYKRPPGVTMDQLDEYIKAVDDLLFPDAHSASANEEKK